jgi:hypothetical protein
MIASKVLIPKIVLPVQCIITLYLHSLFCLTTWSQHSNRDIRHSLLFSSRIISPVPLAIPTTCFCPWSLLLRLGHTFAKCPNLHLDTTLLDHFHATPSSSKHSAINMGRYLFYDESPNEYSFTNEDLWLSNDESGFDTYDFYYNVMELQTPPKMDNDILSNLQSPS